ncbi:ABC transporter substrate-binding protein [Paenibacillus sp. CAA11]|nr:ABC transporter substrate-binding protein [Paenibacillus sp. CAA11]
MCSGCNFELLPAREKVAEEKITLTFRHFWVGKHDEPVERIIADTIKKFEEKHPHIKIDFEGLDQTIHREQKLKSEMVTGRPPDIFSLFGGAEIEPYVQTGRLLDLTGFLKDEDLYGRFKDLSLWTFDQKVYGIPFEGNAEPLFYNKELFTKLRISPPQTISDLMSIIPVLTHHGIIPFALGNKQEWPAAIYVHYFMDRQTGSGKFTQIINGRASFTNPEYLLAMKNFDRLVKMGAFPHNANQLSSEEAVELFTQGKAAMYLSGNWDITLFQKAAPGFSTQIGVLSFPTLQEGDEGSLAGGYTVGLGLSSALTGSKREAALEFIAEIYKPEVRAKITEEAYRIPVMSGEVQKVEKDSVFNQVIALTEASKTKFVPYDNMLPPEIKQVFLHSIAGIVDQQVTPEESLERLEQSLNNYRKLIQNR